MNKNLMKNIAIGATLLAPATTLINEETTSTVFAKETKTAAFDAAKALVDAAEADPTTENVVAAREALYALPDSPERYAQIARLETIALDAARDLVNAALADATTAKIDLAREAIYKVAECTEKHTLIASLEAKALEAAKLLVIEAQTDPTTTVKIEAARDAVNKLPESPDKLAEQAKLDALTEIDDLDFPRKDITANVDVYIRCENMLSLSLDTNKIEFEEFNGVQDMEKEDAVTLTINSSLDYDVNAYLPVGITSADGQQEMVKEVLEVKAKDGVENYQKFHNIGTADGDKIVLLENQPNGNHRTHPIDVRLVGGLAHNADIYKTTIKFEVVQK